MGCNLQNLVFSADKLILGHNRRYMWVY